ncbi:disulfide bond formation protein B [Aureimonas endophytica]|uniref:Disulfide bond formation protein B n=1 Tax=Aureimonas endophytica TaxID=2027858 RepID=A0A916ZUL8_9HYPH|nr:disulfide bond formation protein B [Aureimonas endophytica]GGE14015.1 disulfide bond formation protein B [Aureimonas endophytica]
MTAAKIVLGQASRHQALAAALLFLGATVTVGGALVFQHGFGYIPCALCLKERLPYYIAIPLAAATFALAHRGAPNGLVRALLALIGLVMLWSLYLGVFHAGVEWHWWAGPTDCAVAGGADLTGDLLSSIDAVHPPACDTAAGRFLGLSFAGWNAVASAILAAIALGAASKPGRRQA